MHSTTYKLKPRILYGYFSGPDTARQTNRNKYVSTLSSEVTKRVKSSLVFILSTASTMGHEILIVISAKQIYRVIYGEWIWQWARTGT